MADSVDTNSADLDHLSAKKERCFSEIETEFRELISILESRKVVLQNQVEEIINEMSNETNGCPNVVFTRDTSLKQKLKNFGDIHRKTHLQAKSPPPLNTLSPVQHGVYQNSPYYINPPAFQFGTSLDATVRDAHPTKLSETKISSANNTFKPLCVKKCRDKLFVVSQDEYIYVIDEARGEVLKRIVINFGLFFPAITIAEGGRILFGHSSQYGGKVWIFSEAGEVVKEVVEVPNYGRIKLLSDLDITSDDRVLIVDSDTNMILVTTPDISKVVEKIGQHGKLASPTRVAVNTNNELHILHKRGTTIDVYNLRDECLKSFNLRHQTFATEHIRYNPDLLVTDKYLTLTFDNLTFVYNFESGVFSQAKLDGICGVIPKCIVTTANLMLALKHDCIVRYNLEYFD